MATYPKLAAKQWYATIYRHCHETARKSDSTVGTWCGGNRSADRSADRFATPAPTPPHVRVFLRPSPRNRQTYRHHSLVVVIPYSSEHRGRYHRCRRCPHPRPRRYLHRCICYCCRCWRLNIGEVERGGGSGGNGRRWSGVSAMSGRSLLFLGEVGLGAGIFSRALVNPGGHGDTVYGSRLHDSRLYMVRASWFVLHGSWFRFVFMVSRFAVYHACGLSCMVRGS